MSISPKVVIRVILSSVLTCYIFLYAYQGMYARKEVVLPLQGVNRISSPFDSPLPTPTEPPPDSPLPTPTEPPPTPTEPTPTPTEPPPTPTEPPPTPTEPPPTPTEPSPTPTSAVEGKGKAFGRIESLPSGLIGNWIINGVNYQSTNQTVLRQRFGTLEKGSCVLVRYSEATIPFTATRIRGMPDRTCGSDSTERKAIGIVYHLPDDLIGRWAIGRALYMTDADTQFIQKRGEFAFGVCVEVRYPTNVTLPTATRIRTVPKSQCGPDTEGVDEGKIVRYPRELTGVWVIGKTPYIATTETVFQQEAESFDVGVHVNVKYYVGPHGQRIATSIISTGD
ncbi:hypothetical protein KFU94_47155 [Chloroflexi bacterium TSY]|nr:hypothetical protein [Chloroflexi bacterium TSY]